MQENDPYNEIHNLRVKVSNEPVIAIDEDDKSPDTFTLRSSWSREAKMELRTIFSQ